MMISRRIGRRAAMGLFVLLCVVGVSAFACTAAMAENLPGWEVNSHSYPTNLSPGATGIVALDVYNVGAAPSAAGAIVTDTLPAGLEGVSGSGWTCDSSVPVTCTMELESIFAGDRWEYGLEVKVGPGVAEGQLTNEVAVAGGGASGVTRASNQLTISASPAAFGFAGTDAWFSNANGTLDRQAGSHPYEVAFDFELNTGAGELAIGEGRDISVNVPSGLVANATAVPRCTREEYDQETCPVGSQIGTTAIGLGVEERLPLTLRTQPVYNLVPPPGRPAEFGFNIFGNQVFLDAEVRSDGDYGITEHVPNSPQHEVVANSVTIWGVPADPSHDALRKCAKGEEIQFGCKSPEGKTPFLTLPTSCTGPLTYSAGVNEWGQESVTDETSVLTHNQDGAPQGLTGCEHLGFAPHISVAPDTSNADTPAGLTVELKTPQEGLGSVEGLAMANIKDTTVTLPEGVVINPGQAAGLGACQASEDAVGTKNAPSCPSNSKVGTDEIETPLLAHGLKGNVYVLQSNPPNLKLLVAASGEGVNLKLVGDVHLDEATGRLTTTFTETPELPFTTFRLSFSGGAQAALATPLRCGSYTTTSDFTPWSTPAVSDVFPSSEFLVSHGPGGNACATGSRLPFSPSLTAGSTTDQAGGFTDFSMLLTREDGQQRIGSLQFKTPEGLLGMISKIPLCPEAQANAGTCSSASQIGHTVVEAGPGPYPLVVPQPGQRPAPIYLTGGYKGAPYGLSIVVPLVVGPFTLQTQVVRAKIEVDPLTTQLTVTTDPLPTIIDGIPADLRAINAVIDKPGFMFNPTGCEPSSFSGTATGTEGAVAAIGSHFQMGSCRALTFKPNFKVSTSGKTSRKNGASLDAKIVYPTGELGANQASSQANVKMVKVDLPKQLPSRLTTLQKACPSATFEANPASCPEDSRVGSATAITPVLPVQLTGPAYFVSYGGAKFPELVIVLQGYGVTVFLHGETFISKAGITSSTFRKVPDVPISSFELSLPEGPYSALAANGNLCATKLQMPTAFTGQNGATLKQTTPVSVTGCAKHKAKKTKSKSKSGSKSKNKSGKGNAGNKRKK